MADTLSLPAETQGVWYCCGHRVNTLPGHDYVYSGPMATYCAWHRPMAVFSPETQRTYWVYGNANNAPTITCYDHRTRRFGYPVVLGSNPDGDAHRNPTLALDERGFLHVFYGSHGHPTHVLRSKRPHDLTAWEMVGDLPEPHTTYPQPWLVSPGQIMVSYRQAPGWNCTTTTDGGRTWSEPVNIVNFGCPDAARGCAECSIYAVSIAESAGERRKVHLAWSRLGGGTPEEIATKHLWARRYNVYYAWTDDGGRTWRRSDGSEYTLPVTEDTAEKVYDCGQRGVWLKDIQLDAAGRPLILFLDAEVETFASRWLVLRQTEAGWRTSEIGVSDHMYDDGALVYLSESDIRVYAPTTAVQPQEDGGEIEEWQSADGGLTWANTRHVTADSQYSHNNVKVVFGHEHGPGDLRVVWSYGDSNYPPETTDVRLHADGEGWAGSTEVVFAAGREAQ